MKRRKSNCQPGRRRTDRLLLIAAVCGPISLGAVGIVSTAVLKNTQQIERTEKRDAARSRAADYRLCSRSNAVRAILHESAISVGGVELLHKRERLIPILDCSPNLVGEVAQRIPVDQQRLFVRVFFDTETLPMIENRRVIRTRPGRRLRLDAVRSRG